MKPVSYILLIFSIFQLCCVGCSRYELPLTNNTNNNSNLNSAQPILDEKLELNRRLWSKSDINNYDLKMEIYETGLTGLFSDVKIKVRNGIAIDFNVSGNTQSMENLKDKLAPYDTIEKLFDLTQAKFKQRQEYLGTGKPLIGKFDVSYDQKLGFPKEIKYTPFSGATDGDLYIKVKDFENLAK